MFSDYKSRYVPGNNYVSDNGKTFRYNGRRIDCAGKYIGDTWTSVSTNRNDPPRQIYTRRNECNDISINRQDIQKIKNKYGNGKYYDRSRDKLKSTTSQKPKSDSKPLPKIVFRTRRPKKGQPQTSY